MIVAWWLFGFVLGSIYPTWQWLRYRTALRRQVEERQRAKVGPLEPLPDDWGKK